jgi:hypothetical protein
MAAGWLPEPAASTGGVRWQTSGAARKPKDRPECPFGPRIAGLRPERSGCKL